MTARLWLNGATLITATGPDPEVAGLLVEAGRIAQIGGTAPADAEVVDCAGLTVTPGLIDAHVHMGLASRLEASVGFGMSVAEIAADMFANCAQTLRTGFTTVRDCGGIDAGLAQVVASGKIAGPRIVQCGPIHCQTGGHGHYAAEWEPAEMWQGRVVPGLRSLATLSDGPDQMRKNARESFRSGAEFLKLCVTGGVISKHDKLTDTQFSFDEIAVAVAEATARGTYVTVHAHNVEGIRNAVLAGARCVEHGTGIDEETAALMAARQVSLVPTLAAVEAVIRNVDGLGLPTEFAERAAQVRAAMTDGLLAAKAAGVRIGLGSDIIGPDQSRRGEELTLRAAVESPMAALIAATRVNAGLLGLDSEIGTLEVGKQADIVAFAENPLENPAVFAEPDSVVLALQNGVVVKDERAS
ncbi:metal-dependent hydrolase family protein [Actinocrispum wychmicini]|uniref:Imidazolonepropionase-like amidohydrolase n=1 Tax=Actinocrispum wychmicini TaxID=1213861 RepID=A0A4R2JQY4_9PSEU|nr:amidohydrolase family protein [Actinocrispum wychmicini]TCO59616.1 imidazolonepropionase-like amidohydrolase [Actinocrispum wychmicini]